MGGGASMPVADAISLITPLMELTSHDVALKGVDGPVLITGRAVVTKGDALTIPLSGGLGVYHQSICRESLKGKLVTRVNDMKHLDFALADLNDPTKLIRVPFTHLSTHFQLLSVDRNMEGALKVQNLEDRQQKFIRRNNFEPNNFALMGMKLKALSFSESKIGLDQPISIICNVKNGFVQPLTDVAYAKTHKWGEKEQLAWKTCVKTPSVIVTDRFKCPKLTTLSSAPPFIGTQAGQQQQQSFHKMPSIRPPQRPQPFTMIAQQQQPLQQQPMTMMAQQQQFHSQQPMTMMAQQQPQQAVTMMAQQQQSLQQQPMTMMAQQQQFHSQQPVTMMAQKHQFHSQQPMTVMAQQQQFHSQQPMTMMAQQQPQQPVTMMAQQQQPLNIASAKS